MSELPPKPIRVLIVDDDRGALRIVRQVLEKDPQFEIVGEAEDGEKGVQMARESQPAVIVTDLDMPGLDGIEMMTAIAERAPHIALVMFSATEEDAAIQHGFALGALAFVPKKSPAKLVDAVRLAAAGRFYFGQ